MACGFSPWVQAVCCSDQLHCCPQGMTCDLQHSKCTSVLGQMQPLTRLPEVSNSGNAGKGGLALFSPCIS